MTKQPEYTTVPVSYIQEFDDVSSTEAAAGFVLPAGKYALCSMESVTDMNDWNWGDFIEDGNGHMPEGIDEYLELVGAMVDGKPAVGISTMSDGEFVSDTGASVVTDIACIFLVSLDLLADDEGLAVSRADEMGFTVITANESATIKPGREFETVEIIVDGKKAMTFDSTM